MMLHYSCFMECCFLRLSPRLKTLLCFWIGGVLESLVIQYVSAKSINDQPLVKIKNKYKTHKKYILIPTKWRKKNSLTSTDFFQK